MPFQQVTLTGLHLRAPHPSPWAWQQHHPWREQGEGTQTHQKSHPNPRAAHKHVLNFLAVFSGALCSDSLSSLTFPWPILQCPVSPALRMVLSTEMHQ